MSVPQSPIARLLAWLAVAALLLAGAPAPRQYAGLQDHQQRVATANALAGRIAAVDLADFSGSAQFRLLKGRVLVDAPGSVLFTAPDFLLPRQLKACRVAPMTVRRPSLAGMIELRI